MLENLAANPAKTRGRLYKEIEDIHRTPFERDKDRIVRSTAFRRLQYKTQVFVNNEGDHYRTRLTHSLEVAQIAKSICRNLKLNEDMAVSIAYSHDLGHPPFGHSGEKALNNKMKDYGGFNHNAHTIKIITELEQSYANFNGLNLTWETLEGIAKHNGPLINTDYDQQRNLDDIFIYSQKHDLELDKFPSLEAQITAFADDIAYNNHDVEDGVRAEFLTIEDLYQINLTKNILNQLKKDFPDINLRQLVHEATRRIINLMVQDLVENVQTNVKKLKIKNEYDVRNAGISLVSFSDEINEYNQAIRALLLSKVYRNYRINCMNNVAQRIIGSLFDIYLSDPICLPNEWKEKLDLYNKSKVARVVADYIAGMTDRYALAEYKSFFALI